VLWQVTGTWLFAMLFPGLPATVLLLYCMAINLAHLILSNKKNQLPRGPSLLTMLLELLNSWLKTITNAINYLIESWKVMQKKRQFQNARPYCYHWISLATYILLHFAITFTMTSPKSMAYLPNNYYNLGALSLPHSPQL
jgi:hypothetical protein